MASLRSAGSMPRLYPSSAGSRREQRGQSGRTKPWYFASGRRDVAEQLIAARREKEDRRQSVAKENDKYFRQLDAQCTMYHKWEDNQTLKRYPQYRASSSTSLHNGYFHATPARVQNARAQRSSDIFATDLDMNRRTTNLNTRKSQSMTCLSKLDSTAINQAKKPSTARKPQTTPSPPPPLQNPWMDKPMIARPPPYDIDADLVLCGRQKRAVQKKSSECQTRIHNIIANVKSMDRESLRLRCCERLLISTMAQIVDAKKDFEEKREINRNLKEKKLVYMRFARDRLRQKAFLLCDQLYSAVILIESLKDILANLNCSSKGLLTDDELTQFIEVTDSAYKIVELYLDLNQSRNTEFQQLYHEEAERLWPYQEREWKREYQVWDRMIETLLDTFVALVTEKLSVNLKYQDELIARRESHLRELSKMSAMLKSDPYLAPLLQNF